MEGYKIYEENEMGFTNNERYCLNEAKANQLYHELILKLKKEHEGSILTDEQISESLFGFANNCCEQNLSPKEDKIFRKFILAYEYVTSNEDGTEYNDAVSFVVMELINIEE